MPRAVLCQVDSGAAERIPEGDSRAVAKSNSDRACSTSLNERLYRIARIPYHAEQAKPAKTRTNRIDRLGLRTTNSSGFRILSDSGISGLTCKSFVHLGEVRGALFTIVLGEDFVCEPVVPFSTKRFVE